MAKKKIVLILVGAAVLIAACILAVISFNIRNIRRNNDVSINLDDNMSSQDLKEAKLTFIFESKKPQDTKEVLDQVEKEAKNKLNVKLDFQFIKYNPDAYLSQIKSILAAGQPCDAFYFSSSFPGGLRRLVNDKVIKDITEIFPQYAPNYYGRFSKPEILSASVDGKIYAVPNRMPTAQMYCAIVREDLMKKYKVPDIKSYDDYEVFLKAVNQNEKDIVPMVHYDTTIGLFAEEYGYVILDYQQALVYKWNDPDMKIMAWEQTPEFRKGIEKINDWYTAGYLSKKYPVIQVDTKAILTGKWASIISVLGNGLEYDSSLRSNNSGLSYKTYPLYPEKDSARIPPMQDAMVITAASNNAERALMFINWLQSNQKNYDSLMYGVEGKNYTLVKDHIKLPDDIEKDESYASWGWHGPFKNMDYERTTVSDSADAVKGYYKTIEEKTKYPPHTGFVPDYTTVENTAGYRNIHCYDLDIKVYKGTFNQGDIDVYISDHKTNGADNLVAEVQKQLDKWKAENK